MGIEKEKEKEREREREREKERKRFTRKISHEQLTISNTIILP